MRNRIQVWRRSTGERLPDPLPEGLVKFNPDLTTECPNIEKVEGCCGEGLVEFGDDACLGAGEENTLRKKEGEEQWLD